MPRSGTATERKARILGLQPEEQVKAAERVHVAGFAEAHGEGQAQAQAGCFDTACPHLVFGGHSLVCTGSPLSAGVFPPVRRPDPTALGPLPAPKDTGEKPVRGLVCPDGVLMLFEAGARDTSAGHWNAYDLEGRRRLWSHYDTTREGALADGRFGTFAPGNDRVRRGRVITIDLHAGPQATGAAAPGMSAPYPQTRDGEGPLLVVPGDDARHLVVMARTHACLRSLPLP